MNDTRPEVAEEMARQMRELTPAQRVAKASALFDLAREIAIATLPPGDETDFNYRLFVRIYGKKYEPLARAAYLTKPRAR